MATPVFHPGKTITVTTAGGSTYTFKVVKVNGKNMTGDVRSFLDVGAPKRIAGPYDGSIECSGPYDSGNMVGVFTLGAALTVTTVLSGSVTLAMPVLVEDYTLSGDVEKPTEINVKFIAAGAFSAAMFA